MTNLIQKCNKTCSITSASQLKIIFHLSTPLQEFCRSLTVGMKDNFTALTIFKFLIQIVGWKEHHLINFPHSITVPEPNRNSSKSIESASFDAINIKWYRGSPSYSRTMSIVGLLIIWWIPKPLARPLLVFVFPAPNSPVGNTSFFKSATLSKSD